MNEQRRVALCIGLFLAGAARADDAPAPEYEPGVRLRIYSVDGPLARMPKLVDGQSANLDRTIEGLGLTGEEPFLKEYPGGYLAKLTGRLRIASTATRRFEVTSDAPVTLRIDGKPVVIAGRSPSGVYGAVWLKKGDRSFEAILAVGDKAPRFKVRWEAEAGGGLQPIDPQLLTAEKFYFRPTAPGLKRLAEESDRPGLRQKVTGVHPSLDVATLHTPDVEVPVGGLETLSDGTLVVATFDARRLKKPRPQEEPDGELWLYRGVDGDPAKVTRERIAERLYEPSGLCVVDDRVYVSQRLEITRFDRNNNGDWKPTTVAAGWESNDFHALSFGLLHEPVDGDHPGYLYMAKGTGLGLGRNPPRHGAVWRVDLSKPVGENVEAITGGHRTPNGMGWGPEGTIFVADNQGGWTPANELNIVTEGAFYGFYHRIGKGASPTPFQPGPTRRGNPGSVTEAAIWLPQDEIGNSPAEPAMIPAGWPFAGQMVVADMRYGGVNRVSLDKVGGQWQGCAFRFTQGLEGGVNRLVFGPDGGLYVGAIGGDHAATWNWVDPEGRKTYQGLQRLTPSGRVAFDIEHIRMTPGGFEVRFTKPVDKAWLADTGNYKLQQWTYEATSGYGGPKIDVEALPVSSAAPSAEGRSVELKVDGVKTDRVVHFMIDPVSVDGDEVWSAEAWYTVRRLPTPPRADPAPRPKHVVFVTGDDEYGSEVSMPMIASILERQRGLEQKPGYRVTVLRSVDERGDVDRHGNSIPGLRSLRDADLAVFFLRYRELPETEVAEIERYVASGRPVVGLRTSSHAFRYDSGPYRRLNDGFGDDVLGQQWITHYGHGTTSRAEIVAEQASHPILRGVEPRFGLKSWLYVTDTEEDPLPVDCQVLLRGTALRDGDEEFGEQQPLAWTRELTTKDGAAQRVFYTSLGHPRDFLKAPSRRLLLNAIYWALGDEANIPSDGVAAPMPDGYKPPNPK